MIGRIIIGAMMSAVGFYMVLKTESVLAFFGTSDWAEIKMGPGGSRMFYKLVGTGLCLLGIIVATNLMNSLLRATLGRLLFTTL